MLIATRFLLAYRGLEEHCSQSTLSNEQGQAALKQHSFGLGPWSLSMEITLTAMNLYTFNAMAGALKMLHRFILLKNCF